MEEMNRDTYTKKQEWLLTKLLFIYSSLVVTSFWWLIWGWQFFEASSSSSFSTPEKKNIDLQIEQAILKNAQEKTIVTLLDQIPEQKRKNWQKWLNKRTQLYQKTRFVIMTGDYKNSLNALRELGQMEMQRMGKSSELFFELSKVIAMIQKETCSSVEIHHLLKCLNEVNENMQNYSSESLLTIARYSRKNRLLKQLEREVLRNILNENNINEEIWNKLKEHLGNSQKFILIKGLKTQLDQLNREDINTLTTQIKEIKNTLEKVAAVSSEIEKKELEAKVRYLNHLLETEKMCTEAKYAFSINDLEKALSFSEKCLESKKDSTIESIYARIKEIKRQEKIEEVLNQFNYLLSKETLPLSTEYHDIKQTVYKTFSNEEAEKLWKKVEKKIEDQINAKSDIQETALKILEIREKINFKDIKAHKSTYITYITLIKQVKSQWEPSEELYKEFISRISDEIEYLLTKKMNKEEAKELLNLIPTNELIYHQWKDILS